MKTNLKIADKIIIIYGLLCVYLIQWVKFKEEFFNEIKTMEGLNHPNLVQLFAYTTGNQEGNFMIQEFMAEGALKNYLQKLKKDPSLSVLLRRLEYWPDS